MNLRIPGVMAAFLALACSSSNNSTSSNSNVGGTASVNPGEQNAQGGTPSCEPGRKWCGGQCSYPTPSNGCGATGCTPCPTTHNAELLCSETGTCLYECESGWGDCDGVTENGCEDDLHDALENCGACGTTCLLPANVTGEATCTSDGCGYSGQCAAGFYDVDEVQQNGCEQSQAEICSADIQDGQECSARGVVCWRDLQCWRCAAGRNLVGADVVTWANEIDYCRTSTDPECPENSATRGVCPEPDLDKFCIYTLPGFSDLYLQCGPNGWVDVTAAYPDGPPSN